MHTDVFMDVAAALNTLDIRPHSNEIFSGQWVDKHWMNTPGPIYCGQTDNCGTGPIQAPENVHVDARDYEVIYRQPVNFLELEAVVNAASCDPFGGYGADGDLHWTSEAIRHWWENRENLLGEVTRLHREAEQSYTQCLAKVPADIDFRTVGHASYATVLQGEEAFKDVTDTRLLYMECQRRQLASNASSYKKWTDYIEHGLQRYLQLYSFFLDNRRAAEASDALPML